MTDAAQPRHQHPIGLLLLPGFSLLDLATTTECLNSANALLGYDAYCWKTFAAGNPRVLASNGIAIDAGNPTGRDTRMARMFVLADHRPESAGDAQLLGWLRMLDNHGAKVGAIGSGTFALARADLIRGRACTIHWQSAPKLREAFPDIALSGSVFTIDDGLLTCSGGTAVIDMLVRLVSHDLGRATGKRLQNALQLEHARTENDPQQSLPIAAMNARPRKLQCAIREMEARLDSPTSPDAIAAQVGITTRHLQRLFQVHTGASPARFYMNLRLRRARLLLQQTRMPVLDVAMAVGFSSHSHFSRRYREKYGVAPVKHRAVH